MYRQQAAFILPHCERETLIKLYENTGDARLVHVNGAPSTRAVPSRMKFVTQVIKPARMPGLATIYRLKFWPSSSLPAIGILEETLYKLESTKQNRSPGNDVCLSGAGGRIRSGRNYKATNGPQSAIAHVLCPLFTALQGCGGNGRERRRACFWWRLTLRRRQSQVKVTFFTREAMPGIGIPTFGTNNSLCHDFYLLRTALNQPPDAL
jgi:hypothetical protein